MKKYNGVKWQTGLPPFPSWWLTCLKDMNGYFHECWRFWDGQNWSRPVLEHDKKDTVLLKASLRTVQPKDAIYWCDYWPEGARVERFDLRTKK